MDPILKFCIAHPDVDVSFVGYECKGEHKTVKIELCTINNGKPFRSSRTIGYFEYGRNYEPKDVIRDWDLNFNFGSAVKYISRAGRKGDALEDLKKARQFLDFEIEALGGKEENTEEKSDSACCHCESSYSKYGADIKTMSWEDASAVSRYIELARRYEKTKRDDFDYPKLIHILNNERNTLADERGEDYSGVTAMDYAIKVVCEREIARRCGH